jgi:glycosidase
MAIDTPTIYRSLVIYEIYVRNHGPHGTFADVEADLERIRRMGVDIVWFMPIHPIGQLNKKGSLGCPYSIADYRGINPEYGSLADFQHLVRKAHSLGLKVMIDVVYNHTSHDSVLVREHPEWFHQNEAGEPVTTVPEWSDVIDLHHPNPELTAYLVQTLQQWAELGVDAFRCDVASLLPEAFWTEVRQAVSDVKPDVIWLAESVHASFITYRRAHGLRAISDSEIYRAFDLTYTYDIWPVFQQAVTGRMPFSRYLEMLQLQDAIYPENYVKMRYTENHDQQRIMAFAPSSAQALAWTAFEAFNKGAFLIYAGQESGAKHTPSLFDIDKIDWQDYPCQAFLSAICHLKKDPAMQAGQFLLLDNREALQAAWQHGSGGLLGIFNVKGLDGEIGVPLPDGTYLDLIGGRPLSVRNGKIAAPASAVVLRYSSPVEFQPFRSELF